MQCTYRIEGPRFAWTCDQKATEGVYCARHASMVRTRELMESLQERLKTR